MTDIIINAALSLLNIKVAGVSLVVWIAGIEGILAALLAVAMLVPGDQPDKTLEKILDFVKKYSRKKK
jgi:hypothetical protein